MQNKHGCPFVDDHFLVSEKGSTRRVETLRMVEEEKGDSQYACYYRGHKYMYGKFNKMGSWSDGWSLLFPELWGVAEVVHKKEVGNFRWK